MFAALLLCCCWLKTVCSHWLVVTTLSVWYQQQQHGVGGNNNNDTEWVYQVRSAHKIHVVCSDPKRESLLAKLHAIMKYVPHVQVSYPHWLLFLCAIWLCPIEQFYSSAALSHCTHIYSHLLRFSMIHDSPCLRLSCLSFNIFSPFVCRSTALLLSAWLLRFVAWLVSIALSYLRMRRTHLRLTRYLIFQNHKSSTWRCVG